MFHSPVNALIRVALFPVLLLFWQYVFGTDLPLLAPAMCAVFLTTTHTPPPLIMVFLMAGVLFVTSWLQALLGNLLLDYPHVYYLALLGVFCWCMDRTRKNPQDLVAILLIVSTAMIAVFMKQKEVSVDQIPGALLKNIFIAGFTAYLAYFIFPGGVPLTGTSANASNKKRPHKPWHTLFKASLVLVTLYIGIVLNLAQSTIIAIVVALIIKDPNPELGNDYGIRRLLTTYASLLYAVPTLLMCVFQVNLILQIGVSVICALFMGISAVEKNASYNSIQLLYSSYVVLIFYAITSTSINAIGDELVRFFSVMMAVFIGVMALIVMQPKSDANVLARESNT
ncbi:MULTISPECIES: DUF2955 domain-containing protein [Aeromonas]|uniref:DUF2955 domain-containing protein n=2 Tax=Gammaproteobacteria TaxID=1236 RepID=UPI0028A5429B|nr:DUF2955 domain-containing protein [Aeromonas veronii]ELV7510622.1 DUF2955 domain-containing protein [Aeromonas veronii]